MKITPKKAAALVKAGGIVSGQMQTGDTSPTEETYWIINDPKTGATHHALVAESPNLEEISKANELRKRATRARYGIETRNY